MRTASPATSWSKLDFSRASTTVGSLAITVAEDDLFRTLRVPLLAGRYFENTDKDGQASAVIVNQSLARRCWPEGNALGKTFHRTPGAGDNRVYEVVGIVGDAHLDRYEPIEPTFYRPFDEFFPLARAYFRPFIVRTSSDPQRLISSMRAELKRVEPTMKAPMFTLVRQGLEETMRTQRTYMLCLGLLAGIGLLLAAAGIYGVLACSVARRTREIGIRIAMGAERRHVLGMVMIEGARLTALGVVVGLVAAFWLTQLLRNQLFEVSPRDPWVTAGVVLVLFTTALLACYLPARSATRIDPMTALRSE